MQRNNMTLVVGFYFTSIRLVLTSCLFIQWASVGSFGFMFAEGKYE